MNIWTNLRLTQASLDLNPRVCWHWHSACGTDHVHRALYVLLRMLPIGLPKVWLNGTTAGASLPKLLQVSPTCSPSYQNPNLPQVQKCPGLWAHFPLLSEQHWKILVAGPFYMKEIGKILQHSMGFSLRATSLDAAYSKLSKPTGKNVDIPLYRHDDKVNM